MRLNTPATASKWTPVLITVGAGIVSALQVGKATVALGDIRADLMLDIATASWILSAFALVGAVGGAAIGMAVDRIGDRRMAVAGLVLQSVGAALGGVAPTETSLIAARILEGLGFLAVVVAAPAIVARLAPTGQMNRAMALWATFMPVGLALIMGAGPVLAAITWRDMWLGNAVLLAVYAIVVAIRIPEAARAAPRGGSLVADIAFALRAGPPALLAALFAVYCALFFTVFGFLPTLLLDRLALGPELAGPVSGLAVAAGIVGNLGCGSLLKSGIRPVRILTVGFAVMAVTGVLFFWLPLPAVPALGLCILFALVGGVVPVVVFDAAPRFAPARPGGAVLIGATLGLIMQGNNIGLLAGPSMAGASAAAFGWDSVAFAVIGLSAAAALCTMGFAMIDRRLGAVRRSESSPDSSDCPDRKPASIGA
ncbi:CynX/NimT family MFS transporter [Pacificispira sp.]|uniref:MFS transporter n=1 Tax=Pacificispira sp. TaxID=2888761 RepID=UPI003BAA64BB